MRSCITIVAVGLLSLSSASAASFADAVVKISSRACDDATIEFRGSGLAFSLSGKSYVLTSEHVLFHSSRGFCHSVRFPNESSDRAAELLSADWARGLALLELKDVAAVPLKDLGALAQAPLERGASLTSYGYPLRASTLIQDPRCQIFDDKTHRAFIPLVPFFVEVDGCHVEYGMSGGVAADREHRIAGLLSHQLVRPNIGGSSSIVTLSASVVPDDHDFFLIPWSFAADWARDVIEHHTKPAAVRDPIAQFEGKREVVLADGLRFEAPAESVKSGGVGGPEGTGIGGPEGTGIGGPEGTGIGGTDRSGTVEVVITRAHSAPQSSSGFLRTPWIQRVRSATLLGRAVRVSYFLKWFKGEVPSAGHAYIHSLAEFFSLLSAPDLEPVGRMEPPAPVEPLDLAKAAADLRSIHDELLGKPEVSAEISIRKLLNQVAILSDLIADGSGEGVNRAWLKRLQSSENEGWKRLASLEFDETVRLLRLLADIQRRVEKERL